MYTKLLRVSHLHEGCTVTIDIVVQVVIALHAETRLH